MPRSPTFGTPLNHFLSLLFKMHCWNSIALFCLCTALDKILSPVNAANQTPPHAILWRCSVSRSPPAVDCRECQEAAAADSPTHPSLSRAETLQTLQCLGYAPGPLHLAVTSLLIPVPCLPSPLHIPLSSEMPPAEQSFLSLQFRPFLKICTFFFLYQVKQFLNFWYAPPLPSLLIICLCIPMVLSSVSLVLTTVSFSFLIVSFVNFHKHWILPYSWSWQSSCKQICISLCFLCCLLLLMPSECYPFELN